MSDGQQPPWEQYSSPSPADRFTSEWDFGRAIIFYLFIFGATIVVGVVLFMFLGFAVSAVASEILIYLLLPFVLSRFFPTGWDAWTSRPKLPPGAWATMIFAMLGLVVLISNIPVFVDELLPMPESYREMLETMLTANTGVEFLLLLFVVAVVPGICEEVAFRGLIYQGIRNTYGKTVALVVSSILFAIIHLSLWNFVALVLMGLFLGYLRERSGSIWPGVVAHSLNNALALTLFTLQPPAENEWHYEYFPLWLNLLAVGILLLGMLGFVRMSGKSGGGKHEMTLGTDG